MLRQKALVVGYGSIGRRHAQILDNLDLVSEVIVLSQQDNIPYQTIKNLRDTKKIDPDYIVIASNTAVHFEQLDYFEQNCEGKTILVEKPIFEIFRNYEVRNNSVFVGYNLRFSPIIQLIRDKIQNRKVWNCYSYCGSYLPEWRPGRDYRNIYSADIESGGGVLLDLSHELDYVTWMMGKITPTYIRNEKVSNLEINSDDVLDLIGRTESGAHVQVSLNYFSRKAARKLLIDGENISIDADLINGEVTIWEDGESSNYSWPKLLRNASYVAQHKSLLSGHIDVACNYDEGIALMWFIQKIRQWQKK